MKVWIRCPFCLTRVKTCDLTFYCNYCNKEFPARPGFLRRMGVVPGAAALKCPTCGRVSKKKRCPQPDCRRDLPPSIVDVADVSVAVVGPQDSGKSHYIASLIKILNDQYGHFTLQALTDYTADRYEREFYAPLFKERRIIDKTQSAVGRADLAQPLIYKLTCRETGKNVLLSFYDSAGEDLEKGVERMDQVNRYVAESSGVICLLDPLQLESVRRTLAQKIDPNDLPIKNQGTEKIVQSVVDLIRRRMMAQGGLKKGRLPIPLALAVSKIDALAYSDMNSPLLFDPQSPLFRQSKHVGRLDYGDFISIDSLMGDWIAEANPKIAEASKWFEKTAFFGFTALGAQAVRTGNVRKLGGVPIPCRVEDPFFWILATNGVIPTR